ncbi:unnamed protein product [Gongylonema pulchrum]|uniref:BAR domain-containing protein n=1 Tax=Gongylonema pulchrum TaxID=637853 RepID=A0A183EM85_9BILA|nr:unnamed protein product [Gongylonema pulchrum]
MTVMKRSRKSHCEFVLQILFYNTNSSSVIHFDLSTENVQERRPDKPAAVPATAPPQPPQCSGFRKFLMRISEKIGTVERVEYSKRFNDSCKDVDEYRVVLEEMAVQLMSVIQQNPKYIPIPPGRMDLAAPPNEDPWELLESVLKSFLQHIEANREVEQIQISSGKMAAAHREHQLRGRRALHAIRTFINVDYENIRDARTSEFFEELPSTLETLRQEVDFAKRQLKGSQTLEEIDTNNAVYMDATKNFKKQLHDVIFIMLL